MPSTLGIVSSAVIPPSAFDISTVSKHLWYDASDSSTIIFSSSNIVSQWSDKSGNARHATQSSSTNRPRLITNSDINKPVVFFNGDQQWLQTNSLVTPSNLSIYLVHIVRDNSSGTAPISFNGSSGRDSGIIIQSNGGTLQPFPTNPPYYTDVFSIIEYIGPNTSTATGLQLRALWPQSLTSSYPEGINTSANGSFEYPFFLGSRNAGPTFMSCEIAEIIVGNTIHNALLRRKIEGYLAWKWNITDCLPNTHPHKSTPP